MTVYERAQVAWQLAQSMRHNSNWGAAMADGQRLKAYLRDAHPNIRRLATASRPEPEGGLVA